MPRTVPPPRVNSGGAALEWSDGVPALDAGAPRGEGVEGVAADGESVRAGSADVGGVGSGDSHLQKRGGQQPASGRQTSQYQATMHVVLLLVRVCDAGRAWSYL